MFTSLRHWFGSLLTVHFVCLIAASAIAAESTEFADKVVREHQLQDPGARQLRSILTRGALTRNIGTEDPSVLAGPNNSFHPATRAACQDRVLKTGIIRPNPDYESICKAKWMAPVPRHDGSVRNARVCIDQFEFPNIPCEYPVVWVSASEAKRICASMGKRLCNSHEWEGACAGAKDENNPYRFDLANRNQRRTEYNNLRTEGNPFYLRWAFHWQQNLAGTRDTRGVCGVYDRRGDADFDPEIAANHTRLYSSIGKSVQCHTGGSDYKSCGTNTWPAGMKHQCGTAHGVYDLHGNVAEVTNFPRTPEGLAHGDNTDFTERKGSFFVHRSGYPDDCRVRQPYEHFNQISTDGHSYYQEGFRCCKDL